MCRSGSNRFVCKSWGCRSLRSTLSNPRGSEGMRGGLGSISKRSSLFYMVSKNWTVITFCLLHDSRKLLQTVVGGCVNRMAGINVGNKRWWKQSLRDISLIHSEKLNPEWITQLRQGSGALVSTQTSLARTQWKGNGSWAVALACPPSHVLKGWTLSVSSATMIQMWFAGAKMMKQCFCLVTFSAICRVVSPWPGAVRTGISNLNPWDDFWKLNNQSLSFTETWAPSRHWGALGKHEPNIYLPEFPLMLSTLAWEHLYTWTLSFAEVLYVFNSRVPMISEP